MRIAYVVEEDATDEQIALARSQAQALAAIGHDVHAGTSAADHADVVVRTSELPNVVIVDEGFYRARMPRENEPMRVLLSGAAHDDANGISDGYGAVAHARWFHQKFDLIRASRWAPSREEPLESVQEFHVGLDPIERIRLLHTCDVVMAPSHVEARFGLAAAEAMASGVPAVLSSIPAHGSGDYALFAPAENAVELGERLIELLSDYELRERIREKGRAFAERWRATNAAARLEQFLVDRRSVR